MRIAFITYEFPPDNGKGGIGTYVQQIATALAQHSFDIHVFAGSPYRTASENVDGHWVHWVQCNDVPEYRKNVLQSFATQHHLIAFDCIESPEIGANAWEIKKQFPQLPLIVRLHAPNYLVERLKKTYVPVLAKLRFVAGAFRRFKWDLGYWRTYKYVLDEDYQICRVADAITAPSTIMKNWAVNNWKISAHSIQVIPNIFVPSNAFLQIAVNNTPHKKIVFFGRLNVLKGLVNATKAIKKILAKHPDWQFIVIGDDGVGPNGNGSLKQWMQQQLHPFLNRVIFINGLQYNELPNAIEQTDIVVLPSLFESFSYTCIEAMAAGKAVVASKQTAMADLITHGKNGLLVDTYNVKSIYNAVDYLISNEAIRYQVSLAAKNTVTKNYAASSIEQAIKYYLQFSAKSNAKN